MDTGNEVKEVPFGVCRMWPAEWSMRYERIVVEARAARSAAMGALLVRAVTAPWRRASVLAVTCRGIVRWRDAPTPPRRARGLARIDAA